MGAILTGLLPEWVWMLTESPEAEPGSRLLP